MPRGRGSYRGRSHGPRNSQSSHKPPLTHFLCLPLVTLASRPQLEVSLGQFKARLQELNTTAVFSPVVLLKAVRPIDTLHLTLGVMSLETVEKLAEATELLNSLDLAKLLEEAARNHLTTAPETPTPQALEVSIQSLLSMHNLVNTSVLYATPQDITQRLQPFCEALRKPFLEKGLIVDENRGLKLHATIVNTIYAKAEVGSFKRFDATGLVAEFLNFKWTDNFLVEKLAICKMGAKKELDDQGNVVKEAYEEVVSVELPR